MWEQCTEVGSHKPSAKPLQNMDLDVAVKEFAQLCIFKFQLWFQTNISSEARHIANSVKPATPHCTPRREEN